MAKHDLGDMEKLRVNLEQWLQRQLPKATELSLGELSFPEESGESSVTLILELANYPSHPRLICRMEPVDSQVFDEHDLLMQYQLMELMAEQGVPVPPLFGFEADTSLLGSEFYIMGFVDGLIPTDNPPYCFGSWVTELSDAERATMWQNGLATMAAIHRIDPSQHDLSRVPTAAADKPAIQHELDKFAALYSGEVQKRVPASVQVAIDYVNSQAPHCASRRLCWGDSRVGNVIWRDLKPAAVIDWEMACIADPLQDVSWWYWIDYVNCVGLGIERLGGLPSLQEIYAAWHELTGLPIEHADYYDTLNLLRYTIILEKKLIAMEKQGIEGVGNFCVPFLEQQLQKIGLLSA